MEGNGSGHPLFDGAEACGGDCESALPAACALEMVHTYSLIHDDLPAMDDDDLRRGRSTCHRAFDEATAILAGDGLLTLAFDVLAREVKPEAVALRCIAILAEASGPYWHGGWSNGRSTSRRMHQEPKQRVLIAGNRNRNVGGAPYSGVDPPP